MNSKGLPHVDPDTAERASTRRSMIGAAGLVGAAAIVRSSAASAAPVTPTDADRAGLAAAVGLELAARDLYRMAAAQLGGTDAEVASVVAENHEAYAQTLAAAIGSAASQHNNDVFDSMSAGFDTSSGADFAAAARDLENAAVATHTELLGGYESVSAIELTASIVAVEARHATVFTSMAGFASNLDDLLGSDAAALDLTGDAA